MTKRRSRGRTGCRTCRIRRVKCDEAWPVCRRCSSTGRACDGYEVLPSTVRDQARTAHRPLRPKDDDVAPGAGAVAVAVVATAPRRHHRIASPLQLSAAEWQSLDFFRSHSVLEIPGCFRSAFWERVLLQLVSHEPAILHAAVAVGAMHRSTRGRNPSLQVANLHETDHSFALRQYVKALGHLRARMDRAEDDSCAPVALVSCLLFMCLEMLQGNKIGALAHLRNGLRVLTGIPSQVRLDYSNSCTYFLIKPNPSSMLDQLTETFARLDCQSTLFGERAPRLFMAPHQDEPRHDLWMPADFSSVPNARHFLDSLVSAALHLRGELLQRASSRLDQPDMDWATQYCLEYSGVRGLDIASFPSLATRFDQLKTALTLWASAFKPFAAEYRAKHPTANDELQALLLLEIQHFYVIFQTLTFQEKEEKACDRFNDTFKRIVSLATEYFGDGETSTTTTTTTNGKVPGLSSTFTLESGALPSLYLIATKCRESSIRRKAIELMYKTACQEGMWEGRLIAKFVEKVADIEEAGATCEPGQPIRSEDIPEIARYSDVVLATTEDPTCGRLVCARYMHETTGELTVTEIAINNLLG